MKITEFANEIALAEGKKVQVNIAQIKEILKVINTLLDGEFYQFIRDIKDRRTTYFIIRRIRNI